MGANIRRLPCRGTRPADVPGERAGEDSRASPAVDAFDDEFLGARSAAPDDSDVA